MQRSPETEDDVMNDLPRVLLENYLMLSAALEFQNLGRLETMLQYQQKVHHNLLEIVQHIEDAPAVAMTTTQQPDHLQQQQQQQQHQQHLQGNDLHQDVAANDAANPTAAGAAATKSPGVPDATCPQQQQQQQQLPTWLSNINQPVHQLLQQLGLLQFEQLLEQQHVDLAALQLMEERHMRDLGLPLGAVVKIKAALAVQQQQQQQS